MSDIEQKARALVNKVARELGWDEIKEMFAEGYTRNEALFRAIEQHEAFRQEVSDVVTSLCNTLLMGSDHSQICEMLSDRFIIPTPKPDPLVEIMEVLNGEWTPDEYAKEIRAALDTLGFEIREKGQ